MNYLIALLAFSAIMIVLATLATVLIESIHRIFGKRSQDFERMLAQLYTKSVKPHFEKAGIKLTQRTESFVKQIVENPAIVKKEIKFSNKRVNNFLKLPFIKFLIRLFKIFSVKTSFEELTTRQFIEQLAQSDAGQKLMSELKIREEKLQGEKLQGEIEAKEDKQAAELISKLSYEFERYGQAATDYFKRRAAFFSILVAFVLASTLNIDAIRLYSAFASNTTLAEKVIDNIDVEKLAKDRAEALKNSPDKDDKETINQNYENILKNYYAASDQLEELSLPIGHDYYPYCNEADTVKDPRCKSPQIKELKEVEEVIIRSHSYPLLTWLKRLLYGIGMILSSEDGLVWLFRIILTTGLIGLGAPFWYKTYRTLGQFVPGRQAISSETTAERQTPSGTAQNQPAQQIVLSLDANTISAKATTAVVKADKKGNKKTSKPQVVSVQPTLLPQSNHGLLPGHLLNIFKNTPVIKNK